MLVVGGSSHKIYKCYFEIVRKISENFRDLVLYQQMYQIAITSMRKVRHRLLEATSMQRQTILPQLSALYFCNLHKNNPLMPKRGLLKPSYIFEKRHVIMSVGFLVYYTC